eukprot:1142409-Pelagomonas_calceolata.AAC.3
MKVKWTGHLILLQFHRIGFLSEPARPLRSPQTCSPSCSQHACVCIILFAREHKAWTWSLRRTHVPCMECHALVLLTLGCDEAAMSPCRKCESSTETKPGPCFPDNHKEVKHAQKQA